jgi:glycerol-3-phosphate acyltransferase PlsX
MSPPVKIAVDAMGGDYAPVNEVEGTLSALRKSSGRFEVILVGREKEIRAALRRLGVEGHPVHIEDAPEVITMQDSPTAAVKQKKDSSLAVGMRLHKEGRADALVSAGNTGAVLSASTLILGRLQGVSRPTIGTFFPTVSTPCLLLDAGTNVDCRAQHLFQFAIMGSIYYRKIIGVENPTVGLLNVGEESTKGTEVILETHQMLSRYGLNFVGNVEGRDILQHRADVIVCDGFVGNIVLKFGESVPAFLKSRLRSVATGGILSTLMVGLARKVLKRALYDMDPNEYGGVPVLGVNGVSIVGHGSSTPRGIENMILRAYEVATMKLNRYIEDALASSPSQANSPASSMMSVS